MNHTEGNWFLDKEKMDGSKLDKKNSEGFHSLGLQKVNRKFSWKR